MSLQEKTANEISSSNEIKKTKAQLLEDFENERFEHIADLRAKEDELEEAKKEVEELAIELAQTKSLAIHQDNEQIQALEAAKKEAEQQVETLKREFESIKKPTHYTPEEKVSRIKEAQKLVSALEAKKEYFEAFKLATNPNIEEQQHIIFIAGKSEFQISNPVILNALVELAQNYMLSITKEAEEKLLTFQV